VNSVISIYYYLGPVARMYVGEAGPERAALPMRPWVATCIAVALVGTVAMGIFPAGTMQAALASFQSLR
jgi:NADH:ubiquinone oxidoreductase subunit 2 (subunit N)